MEHFESTARFEMVGKQLKSNCNKQIHIICSEKHYAVGLSGNGCEVKKSPLDDL